MNYIPFYWEEYHLATDISPDEVLLETSISFITIISPGTCTRRRSVWGCGRKGPGCWALSCRNKGGRVGTVCSCFLHLERWFPPVVCKNNANLNRRLGLIKIYLEKMQKEIDAKEMNALLIEFIILMFRSVIERNVEMINSFKSVSLCTFLESKY